MQPFGLDPDQLQIATFAVMMMATFGYGVSGLVDRQRFFDQRTKNQPGISNAQALEGFDPWKIKAAWVFAIISTLAFFVGGLIEMFFEREWIWLGYSSTLMSVLLAIFVRQLFSNPKPKYIAFDLPERRAADQ